MAWRVAWAWGPGRGMERPASREELLMLMWPEGRRPPGLMGVPRAEMTAG
jgi:hypothetical protein